MPRLMRLLTIFGLLFYFGYAHAYTENRLPINGKIYNKIILNQEDRALISSNPHYHSPGEIFQFIARDERQRSPEQRQRSESRKKDFEAMSSEEKRRILETQKKFKKLPPEEREKLKEKWRNLSPEERARR